MNDYQNNLPGIGRHNHANLGKDFERELARTHEIYRRRRIANIRQNPNEWRYGSMKEMDKYKRAGLHSSYAVTGSGRVLVMQKSEIDFGGTVRGGRAVYFDAKTCKGKSFPFQNVKDHQLLQLDENAKVGAVAGLMINMSDAGQVFFVPVSVIKPLFERWLATRKARASLSLKVLETECVRVPCLENLVDWYSVLF